MSITKSKRLLLTGFLTPTQHIQVPIFKYLQLQHAVNFRETKEYLRPFCFLVFLEHGRLSKHSQAFLYYGKILNMGGGIFSLSLFAKLTESFLTEVSQTVLSRNSSLPQVSTWKVRNWSNFNQLKRKSGRDWGRLGPYGTTPFPYIIPLLLQKYQEPSLEFLIH